MIKKRQQEKGRQETKGRDLVADFSIITVYSHQLWILLKMQIWIQEVPSGTWDSGFLPLSRQLCCCWSKAYNGSSKVGRNRPKEEAGGVMGPGIHTAWACGSELRKGLYNLTSTAPPPLFLIVRAQLVSYESSRSFRDLLVR